VPPQGVEVVVGAQDDLPLRIRKDRELLARLVSDEQPLIPRLAGQAFPVTDQPIMLVIQGNHRVVIIRVEPLRLIPRLVVEQSRLAGLPEDCIPRRHLPPGQDLRGLLVPQRRD